MLFKWKVFVPVLSVITAGAVSYPLIYNGGDGSSFLSNNTFTINQSALSREEGTFSSGDSITFGFAPSGTGINTQGIINSSQSIDNKLSINPQDISFSTQNDEISSNTATIVNNLREEITKGDTINEISEEQLKQFEDAIKFVKDFQQGYRSTFAKVNEYRNTTSANFEERWTRTTQEHQRQYLSQQHRKSLYMFFEMFSKLDKYKSEILKRLDTIFQGISQDEFLEESFTSISEISTHLEKIGWTEKDIKVPIEEEEFQQSEWMDWSDNPYSMFYLEESLWKGKINKIKDAITLFKNNKLVIKNCEGGDSSEERRAILEKLCKADKLTQEQVILNYKSEIELDIAVWLLRKMKQIHEERMRRR